MHEGQAQAGMPSRYVHLAYPRRRRVPTETVDNLMHGEVFCTYHFTRGVNSAAFWT